MSIVRASGVFDPFSDNVWHPFCDYPFRNAPNVSLHNDMTTFANPRIDWKETPEAHVYKVDVPRLKKDKVKVQIEEDRFLEISGERNVEKEEKTDKWHRVERCNGKFIRKFKLPENSKTDQVKAELENGVLTVTVGKEVNKAPPKAINVN